MSRKKTTFNRPIVPIILCGGASKRLWPLNMPKQFIKMDGPHSLLQQTMLRLNNSGIHFERPILSCNIAYEDILDEQLTEISLSDYDFIAEPFQKNTAAAFLLAAHFAKHQYGQDAILVFLPSDHLIQNDEAYALALQHAIETAENDYVTTIGLIPTTPHTGFGYIQSGKPLSPNAAKLKRFVEKPTEAVAEAFLKNSTYFWNSGIYVLSINAILSNAKTHCPELLEGIKNTMAKSSIGNDSPQMMHWKSALWIDAGTYQQCEEQPFDKAISEKTTDGAMVAGHFQWKDLGSWSHFADAESEQEDNNGNIFKGQVLSQDVNNCYINMNSDKPVIAMGIENLVLVDTPQGLLITRKDLDQNVKNIMSGLNKRYSLPKNI